MTRAMVHCDDRCHEALWYQVSWSIVMTGFMKHCDKWVMEHCHDKGLEQWDEKFYGGL